MGKIFIYQLKLKCDMCGIQKSWIEEHREESNMHDNIMMVMKEDWEFIDDKCYCSNCSKSLY